jgi:MFS family permease
MSAEGRRVVLASSLGTVFEWYDFYLYGALSPIIAKQFFSGLDDNAAFIFALLAVAVGFFMRPFGALVFGRLGDMIGRKYTFLVTILIMGLATFIVGVLPSYATIGLAAPVALIGLRMLQGLAMGGEYGGAATYVAEHAPNGQRGAYTAWIQTTATLGLLLSLLVILGVRHVVGAAAFVDWGWRVPFGVSILLLVVSVYIRLSMRESPAFARMKAEGRASKAPVSEAFGHWKNLKLVIFALLGLSAGQAVVWYTGQFYALFFLTQVLKVDEVVAHLAVAASLVLGTPFFVVFGAWSDRVGRKPIIMAGCFLAAISYFPVFTALTQAANPDLAAAQAANQVVVRADPAECSFQFNPTGMAKYTSSCDVAKQALAKAAVSYQNQPGPVGLPATITVGQNVVTSYAAQGLPAGEAKAQAEAFKSALAQALCTAGYPTQADMGKFNAPAVIALLTYLVLLVTMVYGPMAAMLVEMFPTHIRYTSMSLPYHIGNGWFGGLLPTMAFAIVAQSGNMYSGLWYPVIIASLSLVVGLLFVRETYRADIYAPY